MDFGFLGSFGLLLEDLALAAVEEGLLAGDEAGFEQPGDALVDGAVALAVADFHQADDLFELALADAVADAVAGHQDLGGEHAALAVGAGDQALADDALERAGELGDDLRLLVGGKHVDEAVDRLRGVRRVEGGEHEVAGFGGGEGDADGVEVAHFGDDDDVGVLAQRLAQGAGKAVGVAADLALFDEAGAVLIDELDGVLEGDDHAAAGVRDALDHRGEGGGFARSR